MTNIIRFEIQTDAPYSDSEKLDLLDELTAFVRNLDGDAIEDTEKLEIVNAASVTDEVQAKQDAAQAFLANCELEMVVSVASDSGDILKTFKVNTNEV